MFGDNLFDGILCIHYG